MKRLWLCLGLVISVIPVPAQTPDAMKSTGYILDSFGACGPDKVSGYRPLPMCVTGTIDHGAKPVFVDERKQVWSVDNPDMVKKYYGLRVVVTMTQNASARSVHIKTIDEADAGTKPQSDGNS